MVVNVRLRSIADRQCGYFTTHQALMSGYVNPLQTYYVKRGHWHRVERALFRLPGYPDSLESAFVRQTLWAHRKLPNQPVVVGYESALYYYGLQQECPSVVHLCIDCLRRILEPAGCRLHVESLRAGQFVRSSGFQIVTPATALLQMRSDLLLAGNWLGTLVEARTRNLVDESEARELGIELSENRQNRYKTSGHVSQLVLSPRGTDMISGLRAIRQSTSSVTPAGRSFTLIEMLVVIAILCILAAMLMPALNQAVSTARATQCGNNQRQLYLTFMRYADDYGGSLPMQRDSFNPAFQVSWFYPVAKAYPDEFPNNSAAWSKNGGRKLWHCPECPLNKVSDSSAQGVSDYGNNSQWGVRPPDNVSDSSLESFILRRSAPRPGEKFMLVDLGFSGRPKLCPVGYFDSFLASMRHSGRVNMLFFDGHTESRGDIDYLCRWNSYGAYRAAADKRPFN